MKLSDLRKVTVKKNLRLRFRLPNGLECVVNEHGIAQVPGLHSVPDFNLEKALDGVNEFILETNPPGNPPQTIDRQELEALTAPASAGSRPSEDRDD